ncbi:hypothetical protein CBM2586_A50198 [Cupriavidus phytorum]|uniref:Uncharacterized protein n=1 Tax=Cupriavidus taiwanensis TaxID=164546 RepID=A0A375C300_9BURK|nr:hypothetical protein CBM2586_A50198 [Cupriavidus taiwanensis]
MEKGFEPQKYRFAKHNAISHDERLCPAS